MHNHRSVAVYCKRRPCGPCRLRIVICVRVRFGAACGRIENNQPEQSHRPEQDSHGWVMDFTSHVARGAQQPAWRQQGMRLAEIVGVVQQQVAARWPPDAETDVIFFYCFNGRHDRAPITTLS
jgi:hypothetical protein